MAKCILAMTGHQAMTACSNLNLCTSLKAGIKGAVHAMGDAWQAAKFQGGKTTPRTITTINGDAMTTSVVKSGQPYATLLVDAHNGFSKLSCKVVMWTICHRWPSSCQFAFNCYQHAAQLVIHCNGRPCSVILSQERVTQGDPILMVIYSIALMPLTETVHAAQPDILQAWYTDDSSFGGTELAIAAAMHMILEKGPTRGNYPEPIKSILICNPAM